MDELSAWSGYNDKDIKCQAWDHIVAQYKVIPSYTSVAEKGQINEELSTTQKFCL